MMIPFVVAVALIVNQVPVEPTSPAPLPIETTALPCPDQDASAAVSDGAILAPARTPPRSRMAPSRAWSDHRPDGPGARKTGPVSGLSRLPPSL